MIITITEKSSQPIYLQLYSQVVSSIAKGELKADSRLPSSRRLAKDLGINYHTVTKAYQLLELEGFVRIIKKRTEIASPTQASKEEFLHRFEAIETELIYEARAKGLDNSTLLRLFQEIIGRVSV